jgi:O-antigen/teichoic acid export membrane protein
VGDVQDAVDPASMAPGFRRLGLDTAIYALGSLSSKIAGLLLLPILTRAMTQAEYGQLDVMWALLSGLTGTLLLGLDAAATRLYFDDASPAHRRSMLGTWAAMTAGTACVAGLAGPLLGPIAGTAATGWLLGGIIAANLAFVFATLTLRILQRARSFALIAVFEVVVYAAGVCVLAVTDRASPSGVLAAWGVSLVAAACLGLVLIGIHNLGRPTAAATKSLLRFGLPIAPVATATLMTEFVHRAILLGTSGPQEVATLTVGVRFASVLGLLIAGFQLAWVPRSLAMGTSGLAWYRIGNDGRRFLAVTCGAALAASLAAPFAIPFIAGANYAASVQVFAIALIASLGTATQLVVCLPSLVAKRPGDVTAATLTGAAVAVGLNLVLAPRMGATGTIAAIAAGAWTGAGFAAVIASRRRPLRLQWRVITPMLAITAIAVVLITDGSLEAMDALVVIASAGLSGVALFLRPALEGAT